MSKTLREYPIMTSHQSPTVGYPFDSKLPSDLMSNCKSSASKFQLPSSEILYSILVGQMNSETSKMDDRIRARDKYEPKNSRFSPDGENVMMKSHSPEYSDSIPTIGDLLSGNSSKTTLSQLKNRSSRPVQVSQYSVKNDLMSEQSDTRRYSESVASWSKSEIPASWSKGERSGSLSVSPGTSSESSDSRSESAASISREESAASASGGSKEDLEPKQEGKWSFDGKPDGKFSYNGVPVVQISKMSINDVKKEDASDDSSTSTEDFSESACSRLLLPNTSRSAVRRSSEELVEQTRSRLMRLSTANRSPPSFYPAQSRLSVAAVKSLSHPGTPPSPPSHQEMRRKYSMGNQDMQRKKRPLLSGILRGADAVDLSVKRKRSEPALMIGGDSRGTQDGDGEGGSILKEALRGRSSTFSFGGKVPDPVAYTNKYARMSTGSHDSLSMGRNNFNNRMRVMLDKQDLQHVKERVMERIHSMVNFAMDLPEFSALPEEDQFALMSSASHRLLLLFLAEANLDFAVAPVNLENGSEENEAPMGEEATELCSEILGEVEGMELGDVGRAKKRLEVPTLQFVEGIQTFIAKCQTIGIRPTEFFFMRWILLFHAGANKLQRGDIVSALNTSARQDLQEIIAHSHPNDKLRYSKLLLTLHTVFGVNCSMLESLFCAPLHLAGGLESFSCKLLRSYQMRNDAVAVAAAAAANACHSKTTES